jgi:BRCT domain type II-containing protein
MANTLPRTSLAGKTVVFTGTLSSMTRNEAKAAAVRLGANIADTVNTSTEYVVAGPGAGSKLRKAKLIGCVDVLSETEWLDIIAEQGSVRGVYKLRNKLPRVGVILSKDTAPSKKIQKTVPTGFPDLDLD